MDPEMLTFYSGGIRVLLVDDNLRFLKTASTLLTLLNFKVSTCGSPRSALKTLSAGDKSEEVDVVLADADKVMTSGFDFKAIVESDLQVPVFYFLSQNHKCANAEADALLRTLDLASFILTKPFEAEDMCSLWRNVAWRKCSLRSKTAAAAGDVGQGRPPSWAWPSDNGEKERVHFRIVGGGKRKGRPGNSGSSIAAPARRRGRPAQNKEQTTGVAGQETDRLTKPTPPRMPLFKKTTKNGESWSMPPQIPEAMDVQPELPPPQRKQSLLVRSVLQTLDVPPYNPSIFSIAGNSTAVAEAPPASPLPTPVFSEPAPTPPPVNQAPPPPAPPRVNQAPQAPAPAAAVVYAPPPPAVHAQQIPAGNIAPPAAATADKEDTLPQLLREAFGPFPYQGPRPAIQKHMFAPRTFGTSNNIQLLSFQQTPAAAGDPFTGMAGGAATGGAAGATHAGGDYGNTSTLMVPQQQEVEDVATLFYSNNNAAMYNNGESSSVAPHQGHGTAYGVNYPALAGGAAFTAPQDSGIVNNQLTTMGVDDLEAMFASDGNEYSNFPLEALMDTDQQTFNVGLNGQQGGEGAVDAAEAFLNGGGGGMEDGAVGSSAVDIAVLEDMLMNNTAEGDMFQNYMNIGR